MPSKVFDEVYVKFEDKVPIIVFQQVQWTAKELVEKFSKLRNEMIGFEHRALAAERAHKRAFNLYRNKLQRLRTRIGQHIAKRDEYKEIVDRCEAASKAAGEPEFVKWLDYADERSTEMGENCHSCGPSFVRKAVLVYRQEQYCAKCFIKLMQMDFSFLGERLVMLKEEFEEM